MSLEVNTGENVKYNGKAVKVASESSAYITVVTEDGERISVARNSALLYFANDNDDKLNKILEENKQKIKEYKNSWAEAKDQKWGFVHQISSFWHELGLASGNIKQLNGEQLAQLNSLKGQKSDAISAMHKASAGVHSTVHESLNAIFSYRA